MTAATSRVSEDQGRNKGWRTPVWLMRRLWRARPAKARPDPKLRSRPASCRASVKASMATVEIGALMGGGNLHPDARLALGHHGIEEADHVDAEIEQGAPRAAGRSSNS